MQYNSLRYRKLFMGMMAAPIALIAPSAAIAQDVAAEAYDSDVLVVTARKSDESILDVPLAVTAFSAATIEQRGISSITDIAAFTPGININSNAASRNDRSAQQLIIRGFTPSAFTNPTASLFINGVPVSSSSAISIISSPERVEILKGPQSAYFGRNTFAGAVNVVNKVPAKEFGGSLGATAGTRNHYKLHADVEGPLLGDWLRFRASLDKFSKNGSYKNLFNPGETLGDQKTTAGTLTLHAEPAPGLTIRAFGMLSADDDGHSDQALVSAYELRDSKGNIVVPNQSNCVLNGRTPTGDLRLNPFMCGVTPSVDWRYQPSANTTLDSFITNFLASPNGRLVSPEDGVQGYGMKRDYRHFHLVVDKELGDSGLTISSLTGYNREAYSQLSDIDAYGSILIPNTGSAPARSYFDYPFYVERIYKDFSQEVRASFDNSSAFRGTLGASYLNAQSQGGLGGGNGALGSTIFSVASGATRNRTFGFFFGSTYDVTDAFSVSLEGRYQIDKIYAYAPPLGFNATSSAFVPIGFYPGGSQLVMETHKNFLPRAIAQLDVAQDIMVYASYSKGVNPGLFNTAFLSYGADQRDMAARYGMRIAVSPEKVTNYEIGVKGQLFDRRMTFALAAYYAPWRDRIDPLTVHYVENNVLNTIRGSANSGSVDMKGVELEGRLNLNPVTIDFSASINDSSINSFNNFTVIQLTGITDFSGKQVNGTSKYSASSGVQYRGELSNGNSWYVRGDWSFKSGLYAEPGNTVRTPDLHLFNARTGYETDNITISAFVNNVFNNKTPISIDYGSLQAPGFPYSAYSSRVLLGLGDLRSFGVEAKYKF